MRAAMTRLRDRFHAAIGTPRPAAPQRPLEPDGRLGAYALVAMLARGRTTEVWRAKIKGQHGFEKEIALKALRPDAARIPEAVRAFTGEATITGRLYHANIVHLVDCGQVGPRTYMAMELVSGLNLRQLTARLRALGLPFPVRLLVQIAQQTCEALHYAHELAEDGAPVGVLHRDLNPDNLMVSTLGAAKLIDFGSARPAPGPAAPWAVRGSTAYMAPERILGAPEDRRSDIYSLGIILHELATGHAADAPVAERPPADPHGLVADLPEALARIIAKAMAREPARRYATAEQMANDLQLYIHDHHARTRREHSQSVDLTLQLVFNQPDRPAAKVNAPDGEEITRPT
jgi:serine/threonine-protein kinase